MTNRQKLRGRVLDLLSAPGPPVLKAASMMQAIDDYAYDTATLADREAALASMTCRTCRKPLVWRAVSSGRQVFHTAWCCDRLHFTNKVDKEE